MNAAIPIGVVVWLVLVFSGFLDLTRYGSTAGAEGQPPGTWPRDVSLCLDQRVPTLLVFAHPRCPCTAATLAELDRVMTRCASRLAAAVVFYADPEQGPEWAHTESWEHAARTPGVTVTPDPGGALAAAFGAMTSGVVRVYSPKGVLLFAGGITASRGHEGENAGSTAIEALVNEGMATHERTPVFGCPLQSPEPQEYRR